jgi:hypothetical protein
MIEPATLTPEQTKALFIKNFMIPMREALSKPEPLIFAVCEEFWSLDSITEDDPRLSRLLSSPDRRQNKRGERLAERKFSKGR